MADRETITDITTNDRVYIQHQDADGFSVDPAEAMVLARELMTHAMTLAAPEFECDVSIILKVPV